MLASPTTVGLVSHLLNVAGGEAVLDATLEPRLVMKGMNGKPYISGDFFVAAYQRGYRWGPEEVGQLLDDLAANAKDSDEGRVREYYLQPIVVIKRVDGSWELVDGQQRLTTLYLIARFISNAVPGTSVDYTLHYETRDRETFASSDYLKCLGTPEAEAHKTDNIDFHHMFNAYAAIKDWFDDPDLDAGAAFDIRKALTSHVYVIWYEAPADTDPNELFIRLNRDRIALTDSELIKALVLSNSGGAAKWKSDRKQEIAAQWDGFERDLGDEQFWAFLKGTTTKQPTHIDFLFESMTPQPSTPARPLYWTFARVYEVIERRGATVFWRDVVARHGLLMGWYHDHELYHRIGYLVAIGDSIPDLIETSQTLTHSQFRHRLIERTRKRLNLTADEASLLRYDNSKAAKKCTEVLLLMNVETVLCGGDMLARFRFYAYAGQGWSLEHIHAQNAQGFRRENERRDWLRQHLKAIQATDWGAERRFDVDSVRERIAAHLDLPEGRTDSGFETLVNDVFTLFSTADAGTRDGDMHGLGNLVLLQRNINSKLSNAVFALKRERIITLDQDGAYLLPCTRNVFLKYYTTSADQQLSLWGPQDQESYYDQLIEKVGEFLTPPAPADRT